MYLSKKYILILYFVVINKTVLCSDAAASRLHVVFVVSTCVSLKGMEKRLQCVENKCRVYVCVYTLGMFLFNSKDICYCNGHNT